MINKINSTTIKTNGLACGTVICHTSFIKFNISYVFVQKLFSENT